MTGHKIIVRNSPNWQQHKAVTLGVSVTSPNWQDKKFESILEFAASRFQVIRIDVTDGLYRHGFMADGMTSQQSLVHANNLGDLWLARHGDIINSNTAKPTVVRWAEWYSHPDFEENTAGFQKAYEISPLLKEAVDSDVMDYYRRKQRSPSPREYQASQNYFIEELAVLTIQARELPGLRLYPGDELRSLNVVRSSLVPEAPSGLELEQFAKVKFEPRSQTEKFTPMASVKRATLD